ncbi:MULTISPECIES: hypothetical protein [Streptomyces]|uniref:Integral membrane protein n=1 Tax=Streptomyces solicathayae TaxID=3081768 RepID=A0ABZ0LV06_9ACTN|nr:hypothetical protein [Streptomyces sp. HUAS YS2]WOX23150.1 hypothetical protein R2D22_17810 [Streptomyces sp. HUAS YS2]
MAAHAAVPIRRHVRHYEGVTRGWGFPVTLGVVYGLYTSTVARGGGGWSWGQLWLGLISGAVLAGAVYAVHTVGPLLPRELHAAAWGVVAGGAVGFLFSLSDASILSSSVLGLIIMAGTTLGMFYMYYTHEDARGRPIRN